MNIIIKERRRQDDILQKKSERVPLWLVNEDDDKITYLQHNKGKECLYGHTQH